MGKYPSITRRNGRKDLKAPATQAQSICITRLVFLAVFFYTQPYTALAQVIENEVSVEKNLETRALLSEVPEESEAVLNTEISTEANKTTVLLEELMRDADFNDFIVDKGIVRSDRVSSYLLFQAESALRSGREDEAIKLGQMASKISPLSPTPSFFMAKVIWQTRPFDLVNILFHYLKGVQLVFSDFLLLVSVLSPFLLFLLFSTALSMLAFIFYSLFAFLPIWVHHIFEHSKGYVYPIPAGLIFTLLLIAPLLLGLPVLWFMFFAFALFWGFYSRLEKTMVFIFIFGLGVIPWVLPFVFTIFTANSSLLLDEMSRNYHSDYLWTPPPLELEDAGWEGWFIRASYEAQGGDYVKATRFYQKALEGNPDSPMILNNLGNLAFYSKHYDKALEYYQKALVVAPSLVSAHYNMSQAYREMLLFKKGEATFAKAHAINTQSTEKYAMQSARYPNFPVIEERFTKADLVNRLLSQVGDRNELSEKIWQGLIGNIALNKAPMIAVIWVVLLLIAGLFHKSFISGTQCAFCKKAICNRCTRRLFSYQVCRPCEMRFMTVRKKSDFTIVEDAVKRIPARLYPLFILPGGGHLAIRWTKTGLFFLAFFFMLLSSIFISDLLIPPTAWYLHRSGSVLPIVFLIMLYLVVLIDLVIKRGQRKWL